MTGELIAAVAAAVIAAGALGVSVVAIRQTRRLADRADGIQAQLAAVEAGRRLEELRPVLGMTARHEAGGITLTLNLSNEAGTTDLEHVHIVGVVDAPPVIARDVQSLVNRFYPLRMGASEPMSIAMDANKDGGQLVLRVRLKSAVEEWEQTVRCDVPHSIDMDLILRQEYVKARLREETARPDAVRHP